MAIIHTKSSLGIHLFGKLILTNIIKIVATRCQILRLKCSKFDFGWGSARPPSRIKGLTSKGREGERGTREGRLGERKGMGEQEGKS